MTDSFVRWPAPPKRLTPLAARRRGPEGVLGFASPKHISMTDGTHIVIIPRQPVIKPGTLRQILDAAGLTVEEIRELL